MPFLENNPVTGSVCKSKSYNLKTIAIKFDGTQSIPELQAKITSHLCLLQ
jgi:hypothetical protein